MRLKKNNIHHACQLADGTFCLKKENEPSNELLMWWKGLKTNTGAMTFSNAHHPYDDKVNAFCKMLSYCFSDIYGPLETGDKKHWLEMTYDDGTSTNKGMFYNGFGNDLWSSAGSFLFRVERWPNSDDIAHSFNEDMYRHALNELMENTALQKEYEKEHEKKERHIEFYKASDMTQPAWGTLLFCPNDKIDDLKNELQKKSDDIRETLTDYMGWSDEESKELQIIISDTPFGENELGPVQNQALADCVFVAAVPPKNHIETVFGYENDEFGINMIYSLNDCVDKSIANDTFEELGSDTFAFVAKHEDYKNHAMSAQQTIEIQTLSSVRNQNTTLNHSLCPEHKASLDSIGLSK